MTPCLACEGSGWFRTTYDRGGRTYPCVKPCNNCAGRGTVKPFEGTDGKAAASQSILPGMESAVEANHASAVEVSAEELGAEFQKPLGNIDAKAARMEMSAPLFYGQIHPTLF